MNLKKVVSQSIAEHKPNLRNLRNYNYSCLIEINIIVARAELQSQGEAASFQTFFQVKYTYSTLKLYHWLVPF